MTEAPCIVVTENDLNAELAMIDENLCRTDMSLAERAKMMVRRKELYEEKHPESRGGTVSARAANSAMGRNVTESVSVTFAASTAATIGKHERVVRLDVQRGTEIVPEALDLVARRPLDKAR